MELELASGCFCEMRNEFFITFATFLYLVCRNQLATIPKRKDLKKDVRSIAYLPESFHMPLLPAQDQRAHQSHPGLRELDMQDLL